MIYLVVAVIKGNRDKDKLIQSLTHLATSKDAMTYAALQANATGEELPDVYVSKSDEDEAVQWETLTGVSDDDAADLRELGLRN